MVIKIIYSKLIIIKNINRFFDEEKNYAHRLYFKRWRVLQ